MFNKMLDRLKHTNKYLLKNRSRKIVLSIIHYVLVIGICFIILYPLFVKIAVAFKSEADLYDRTVIYIPREFTFSAIVRVFNSMDYLKVFFSTFFLSSVVSILQIISCTLVGYGFARFRFPGKKLLFFLVIITIVVPPQTVLLPTYLHFRNFDIFGIFRLLGFEKGVSLIDNVSSFAILSATTMGFKNGLYIYIIQQFFRGVPKELEEASYVDGAGTFKTFYRVLLPGATSIIATVFLFSFVWQWTDVYYSSFFLNKTQVLANVLMKIGQNIAATGGGSSVMYMGPAYYSQINNIGSLLTIIPLLILYGFTQKFFVESIERSGIVG